MSQGTFTVVIPTWQRAAWLAKALAAVARQTVPPLEVIVVGRAEDEEARAVTARATDVAVRWVEVDRPGHVAPIRRGLAEVSTPLVAFLDDDCEPQPEWLEASSRPFADVRVACVGGRVSLPGYVPSLAPDAGTIRWYGQHMANVFCREDPSPVEVDGVMEASWCWRVDILRSLTFDPALDFDDAAMYGLDLTLQAKERGYRTIYTAASRVDNSEAPRDPSLDRADLPMRVFGFSRNYMYVGLKHFSWPRRLVFVAFWFIVGERGSYGLLTGVYDAAVTRRPGILRLTIAGMRGKVAGIRCWLSGRV